MTIKRAALWAAATVFVVMLSAWIAFQVSFWPWILVVRHNFTRGDELSARTLAAATPHDVTSRLNIFYGDDRRDERLDVFYPQRLNDRGVLLPTVVWIHGGGWVSGSKEPIADYLRILAHEGYTTVAIEYSHAPEKTYPAQLLQANQALAFLIEHAAQYNIDPNRIVLAGDSAGAQIAAQLANVISSGEYAHLLQIVPSLTRPQLKGVILYSGAFEPGLGSLRGISGSAGHAMLWAYLGKKNYLREPSLDSIHLFKYVTSKYPRTFLSTGNRDPLLLQSQTFARILQEKSVEVDSLFFTDDPSTNVPHEYQFLWNTPQAQQSFQRLNVFLRRALTE